MAERPRPVRLLHPSVISVSPEPAVAKTLSLVPEAADLAEDNWEATIKPFAGVGGKRVTAANVLQMLQKAYSDLWGTGGSGDGTVWHHGSGAPTNVPNAKPGDYYLDTTTGDVYQLGAAGFVKGAEVVDGTYVITSMTPEQTPDHQPVVLSLV